MIVRLDERSEELVPGRTIALLTVSFVLTGLALYGFFALPNQTDFRALYNEGLAWQTGAPLYQPNPSVNMNPPTLTLLAFAPIASLPYTVAQAVWTVLNLIGVASSLRVVARTLHLSNNRVLISVGMLLVTHGMFQQWILGQFIGCLMYPITRAWVAYREFRYVEAGAWLAPAIAIKPPIALIALLLATPTWLSAGMFSGLISVVALLISGVGAWQAWLNAAPRVDWVALPFNASLWGMVARWQEGRNNDVSLGDLSVASVALVILLAAILAMNALRQQDQDRRFLCAGLFSILLSPLGWGYYIPLIVGPAVAAWPNSALAWTGFLLTLSPVGANPDGLGPLLSSATFAAVLCTWVAYIRRPGRAET